MSFLICPHGYGIWHWIIDIGMSIPFLVMGGMFYYWFKAKVQAIFKRGKK